MSHHKVSSEEVYTFTSFINNNLKKNRLTRQWLPMNPESEDLFDSISESNGLVLAQLILFACDPKQKEAVEKELNGFAIPSATKKFNVFVLNENFKKVVKAAIAMGVKVINIDGNDIKEKKQHLVLGILWQVIKMALQHKIEHCGGNENQKFSHINQAEFDGLILSWANEQLSSLQAAQVGNLQSDFADGTAMLQVCYKLAKDALIDVNIEYEQIQDLSPEMRMSIVFSIADDLGIERFCRPQDMLSGNQKIIFTMLSELFTASIQREMVMGKDQLANMDRKQVSNVLNSSQQIFSNLGYRGHYHWNVYRAGGLLDPIDLLCYAMERCKNLSMRYPELNFQPLAFEDVQYQLLIPGCTEIEIETFIGNALRQIRDVIDSLTTIYAPELELQMTRLCQILMICGSDDKLRLLLAKIDFISVVQRLFQKDGISSQIFLYISFLLHELATITGNTDYDKLVSEFAFKNPGLIAPLNYIEQCAFLYIGCQNGSMSQEKALLTVQDLIGVLYLKIDKNTTSAADMLFNTLLLTSLDVSRLIKHTENALQNVSQLSKKVDEESGALLYYLTVQLIEMISLKYPNDILNQFQGNTKIISEAIETVTAPTDLEHLRNQRQIFAAALLLSVAGRLCKQLPTKCGILKEKMTLTDINQLDIFYIQLVEDNLANDLLRQAARLNVETFMDLTNFKLLEHFIQTFFSSAKSTSITAVLQSFLDLQLVKLQLKNDLQQFVKVLDTVLGVVEKYEMNEMVYSAALRFFTDIISVDAETLLSCQALDQLDKFMYDLLDKRAIALLYVAFISQFLKVAPQLSSQLIAIVSESINKIQRTHEQDKIINTAWFDMAIQFAGTSGELEFVDNCRLFDVGKEALTFFTGSAGLAILIYKALVGVIKSSAALCLKANEVGLFGTLKSFARFYKNVHEIQNHYIEMQVMAAFFILDYQLNLEELQAIYDQN